MKLHTTLVFNTTTATIIYTTKIIAQAKLHMQPKQQWYRKLIETSEKHNWSSRPPTIMSQNFLKNLMKLPTTFVFTTLTENVIIISKMIAPQKVHMQPNFRRQHVGVFTCFPPTEISYIYHSKAQRNINIDQLHFTKLV